MKASLFLEYVEKYFTKVVGLITEKNNDQTKEQPFLHETMLVEEYSPDLNWGSEEINNSVVAADVVSLESSLPLKSRAAISTATGKIPKIGMKMRKGEKQISDINVMIARGAKESIIAAKIFDDVKKGEKGVKVRKEILFLQGFSTGVALAVDTDNNGTGVRATFGYKDENTFAATKAAWGEAKATPQDDVQQLFDKANVDGNSIEHVYLSKKYFDLFRHSEQGKLLAANFRNVVVTDKALLAPASRSAFLDALEDEYGAKFHIIDSSFRVEKPDGTMEAIKPWAEANIVATPTDVVGRLVYGTLAEETNPVEGVKYEKVGTHTLISKYSKVDPLEEFTAAQALCIPVIDGADGIYLLTADKK